MKKIRKISSVSEWHGYETTIGDKINNTLFIVRQKDYVGIVDDAEKVVVSVEYDSITPLGSGMWLARKKDKYGVIRLTIKDHLLCAGATVPCEYDYIYCQDIYAVKLCTYDEKEGGDHDNIYLPSIDKIYERATYDSISSTWCYVVYRTDEGEKSAFVNRKTGTEIEFDPKFFPAGETAYEGYNIQFVTMCALSGSESKLVKLQGSGNDSKITVMGSYEGMPTFVFAPGKEGMEGPIPVVFIGKREGRYIWINRDLEEFPMPFEDVSVTNELIGRYKGTVINQRLSTMFNDDIDAFDTFDLRWEDDE